MHGVAGTRSPFRPRSELPRRGEVDVVKLPRRSSVRRKYSEVVTRHQSLVVTVRVSRVRAEDSTGHSPRLQPVSNLRRDRVSRACTGVPTSDRISTEKWKQNGKADERRRPRRDIAGHLHKASLKRRHKDGGRKEMPIDLSRRRYFRGRLLNIHKTMNCGLLPLRCSHFPVRFIFSFDRVFVRTPAIFVAV